MFTVLEVGKSKFKGVAYSVFGEYLFLPGDDAFLQYSHIVKVTSEIFEVSFLMAQ